MGDIMVLKEHACFIAFKGDKEQSLNTVQLTSRCWGCHTQCENTEHREGHRWDLGSRAARPGNGRGASVRVRFTASDTLSRRDVNTQVIKVQR